ncbi:anaerobic glycerol-3-phosphate dehydrogenase subunit GlpB [Desulfitobacterium metallireducens]|uniref:Glycerol-3-phosphate dehydrogenase n=1 Tax=Desulfitobacterium metallireducens DSM 15288 TaxID=871968 RepID=W0EGN7_9FIRM|nr:anaerobic glycerol-3-phosphate dehydrogenase subunit GlpB [Desulfitobacterium metallireducens]AHF08216.1 glycerol-3-phosphate dehydrogenase [Desulfitobacterium metallireducens DSM 15288]
MWDGVIIGGGLAGLVAGIRASERGLKMLLISEGTGSLTYSSGALDIGATARLAQLEKHPYALFQQKNIRAGLHYFQTLFPEYQMNEGESFLILTPLGSCRTTEIVPMGLKAEVLAQSREIVLLAPREMRDFFAAVVKANLEKEFPQSKVSVYPFRVSAFADWEQAGKAVNGMEYARFWRTEAGRKELKQLLDKLAKDISGKEAGRERSEVAVIFPGLTRIFSEDLQNLFAQFPYPVVEMTDMPPAFGGTILERALKTKFKAFGGEIILGSGVLKADVEGKICKQVHVQSKGRDSLFKAREFILATGGIFGGGIEVTPDGVREKVLGLPLFVPEGWTQAQFLGEQPYARLGVEVDQELRPLDLQEGDIGLENVRVVGRMLAHWDPWVEHCGGGVSIVSGYLAGESL